MEELCCPVSGSVQEPDRRVNVAEVSVMELETDEVKTDTQE